MLQASYVAISPVVVAMLQVVAGTLREIQGRRSEMPSMAIGRRCHAPAEWERRMRTRVR